MKIVVPIMPKSIEDAHQLDATRYGLADIIEWRADYLPKSDILKIAPIIFEKFSGYELLFTLRTVREGGQIEISDADYIRLLKMIQERHQPNYIDFEYFSYTHLFKEMLDFSNLVLSYHNFKEMPKNIIELLSEMTNLGPKVVKIAVMPQTNQDVLDLMNFSRGFKTLNEHQDYAVIAMGTLGRITGIAGDLMGSSWTFSSMDKVSAPGQISLTHMSNILEVLNED